MQKFKIEFKCRINRMTQDGFSALENDTYLIRFQDSKHAHIFNDGDTIIISLENTDEPKQETTRNGYSVIYCTLKNHLSNGFQFSDVNSNNGFFWSYRGIITYKLFENTEIWETGTLIRIMIKRL